jgi:uncharacterized protein (DUF1501 family)
MLGAAGVAGALGPKLAFANGVENRYLLLVILRGALDGLASVIPYHDSRLGSWREVLVPPAPGQAGGALSLGSDGFALHPSLNFMHNAWREKDLAIVHAVSSPYRERSHFDGQDVLESGVGEVFGSDSGWLNRALLKTPGEYEAAAVGAALPLVLRGDAHAVSWAPSSLPEPSSDTVERLMQLYENDEPLQSALADALALSAAAGDMGTDARGLARGRSFVPLIQAGANLLASDAAGVVVLSLPGWDTHSNQGAEAGALAQSLGQLDEGLAAVKKTLAERWNQTAVVVMTEFGRTVRVNGSRGTDHGTGGAAFLLGGAVAGGKIVGDWPGLAKQALYEGRDLYPANDLRSLFKGVLRDHMGVAGADLERSVFPDSAAAASFDSLISG